MTAVEEVTQAEPAVQVPYWPMPAPSRPWPIHQATAAGLPPHIRGLMAPGEHLVITDTMKTLAGDVAHVVQTGTIAMLSMPSGQGKSITLAALASVAPVPMFHIELAGDLRGGALWTAIAMKIIGADPRGNIAQKQDRIAAELRKQRCLLALDDAQNASLAGLLALRYLSNATNNGFGILLAGHNLAAKVAREVQLDTRIKRRIVKDKVPFSDVLKVIVPLHPGMRGVRRELLATVHDWTLRGSLREWADLIAIASELQAPGQFTADTFADALTNLFARTVTAAQLTSGARPRS